MIDELKKIVPFKFRIWSWYGSYKTVWQKKEYDKYIIMPYIDARDCMDRLDEVCWSQWKRDHYDVWGKSYCSVSIYDKHSNSRVSRWDVWEPTAIAKNKGEASDAFKRACVNRWLWRFLYTMPKIVLTSEECKKNQYNITEFVKKKHSELLMDRFTEYNINMDAKSKYQSSDDDIDKEDIKEKIDIKDAVLWFTKS